jgi:Protein of unknown function (DUF4232)
MTQDRHGHQGDVRTEPSSAVRPMTGRRRAVAAGALLAATALGLAACGSSSSTSTTTTQHPTTTSKPSTSSTSTTASTGASTSTTSRPSSNGCATSALTVTFGDPNGTAGAIHYTITFHNTGASSCTLTGYPGVSFLTSGGSQIGAPAQRGSGSVSTVTVAAGGNAYSSVAVTDPGIPPCSSQSTATQVRVYPPDQTQAALVSAPSVAVCSSPNTSAYQSAQVTPVTSTPL